MATDKQLKISFCTTCKGRTEHVKKTLPQNLANNAGYPNTEFVILDYDSKDGLAEWMRATYPNEIASGKIRFAQFAPAPHFKMAHAKNMAHRLATGDVLCNLDADNITGPGFASWLNKAFSRDPDVIVSIGRHSHDARRLRIAAEDAADRFAMKVRSVLGTPCTKPPRETELVRTLNGMTGRIALSRDNFYHVRGYAETYTGYGGEDHNIKSRARAMGLRHANIPASKRGAFIGHDNAMRVAQMAPEDQLASQVHFNAPPRPLAQKIASRLLPPEFIGPKEANPDGRFGCGIVRLNFGEEVDLLPVRGMEHVAEARLRGRPIGGPAHR